MSILVSIFFILTSIAQANECKTLELIIGDPTHPSPILASLLQTEGSDPLILSEVTGFLKSKVGNCLELVIIPNDVMSAPANEAYMGVIHIWNAGDTFWGGYKTPLFKGKPTDLLLGEWRTGFSGDFPGIFSNDIFQAVFYKLAMQPRFVMAFKNDAAYIDAYKTITERVLTNSDLSLKLMSISAAGYIASPYVKNFWIKTEILTDKQKEDQKFLAAAKLLKVLKKVFVDPGYLSMMEGESIIGEEKAAQVDRGDFFNNGRSADVALFLYGAIINELAYIYNGTSWVPDVTQKRKL